MKEVEDENALKHMFDKAHLKRTADVNNVGGTETRPGGFEVLSDEDWLMNFVVQAGINPEIGEVIPMSDADRSTKRKRS